MGRRNHVLDGGTAVLRDVTMATNSVAQFVMAALFNRAGHYIFALWFLSSFYLFSSPNLSGRRLDAYHTSTHGVALVQI